MTKQTIKLAVKVSTHSRAKAAAVTLASVFSKSSVSTHSRAKAAADRTFLFYPFIDCFNTQPREGGCIHKGQDVEHWFKVSTHSRAKAAAQ